jgi:hypothetical protein
MVPHSSTNSPMETPPTDHTVGALFTLRDPINVTPPPQKDPVEVTPPPQKDPVEVTPPPRKDLATLKDPIDVVPPLLKVAVAPPTTKDPLVLVTPALKTPETGDDSALVLTRVTCRRVPILYHSSEFQFADRYYVDGSSTALY